MELIVRRSTFFDKNAPNKIVLKKESCPIYKFIKKTYPNWEIIFESDLDTRYQLLLKEKVDCIIDSSYSFNYLSAKAEYPKLTYYPVTLYYGDINIVLKTEQGRVLAQIINKSITQLKKNNLNNIVEKNISKILYTPSFVDLFVAHRIEYLGVLFVALIFFSIIYVMASNRRRQELEKINNNLIIAESKAIEANNAKGIFLARMSHDMRTPLGAVIALASFGINESESDNIKSYFDDIEGSAKYLLSLIDDILDSQKLQNDNFDFKYSVLYICNTVNRVKTVIETKAKEKNIKLIITNKYDNLETYFLGDEKRVSQIFINILSNAIKYTHENGIIHWDLSFKKIDKNKIMFFSQIRDTGVGMSSNFIKNHLFKPFTKEENSLSKAEGGSGLGLNICKKLITQMNGSIECKSTINQGTTFSIEIPFEIASKEDIKNFEKVETCLNTEQGDNVLRGIRVLVCDDTEINIKIAKKILEKKQVLVEIAKNGQEAVKKVQESTFDAVLMDIRMPILDGLEATKIIREFNKNIPIIAFSANAYADDIKQSLDVGMNAHLAKPIDTQKLFSTLEKLIFKKIELK